MNTKRISQLLIITMTLSLLQPAFAGDAAFTLDTRVTSATVTSKNASGVTARVSTSFDVPSRYRNQFPRNSTRYVQVPKLRVIEGAKQAARGSALNVGLLAAVAAAGWAIDELTGQITVTSMQPNPNPNIVTDPVSGYRWRGCTSVCATGSTPSAVIAALGAAPDPAYSHMNQGPAVLFGGTQVSYYYYKTADGNTVSSIHVGRENCPSCQYDPILLPVESPVTQQQLETELWPHIQSLPNHVLAEAFAPNPLNTPEIAADLAQQYAEIAANNPNLAYDPATNTFTYTDPDTGEEVSTNPNADPDLNPLDLPDDYARENTQTDILTALRDFFQSDYELEPDLAYNTDTLDPNSPAFIYKLATDQLHALPDLPDFVPLPDFGLSSSSSCQTITFNWRSASVVFPSPDQCAKLAQFKQIMGWFLYIITWFGVVYIILGNRQVKSI